MYKITFRFIYLLSEPTDDDNMEKVRYLFYCMLHITFSNIQYYYGNILIVLFKNLRYIFQNKSFFKMKDFF